jgi:hypothetical protein
MKKTIIGISNTDFATKLLLKQIKFQEVWFREIIRNALEATEKYYKENPHIKIPMQIKVRAKKLLGLVADYTAPKLSVINYGGMTMADLKNALQLFCIIDKIQDYKRNFGVGLKIALARFTEVMFITFKEGKAHRVAFSMDDQGQLTHTEILDCTTWAHDSAEDRGYDMNHDWTEVILLGKGPNKLTQNTLTHTFDAEQKVKTKLHAMQQMFTRFVDIPRSVEVQFESGDSSDSTPHNGGPKSGTVNFKTKEVLWENGLQQYPNTKARKETYTHNTTGIKVTLIYDAPIDAQDPKSDPISSYSQNRLGVSAEFTALIWGDAGQRERYDIIDKNRWKRLASDLGIYCDYQYFKIEVELPFKDYTPSMDRSELHRESFRLTDENHQVFFKDFVEVIKEVMQLPEAKWFVDLVQEHNAKAPAENLDALILQWLKDYYQQQQMLKDFKKQSNKDKSGKNDKKSKPDIEFSDRPLECPKCRKKGIKTPMPKGQKICTVCGYERKHITDNTPKSAEELLANIPLPEFRDDTDLGKMFARFTSGDPRDILHTNPKHKAVDLLLASCLQGSKLERLNAENRDNLKRHAYKMLQLQAGVTTILAQASQEYDEWFTPQTFKGITSEEHYTFQALQISSLVPHLKDKALTLLKQQDNFVLEETIPAQQTPKETDTMGEFGSAKVTSTR